MIEIKVRNGSVEGALRVLKKRMMKEGTLKKVYDRKHYTKPSEKKYRKLRKARYNNRVRAKEESRGYV